MDASVLSQAMGASISLDAYARYCIPMNAAMLAAGCTTVQRAAMWCAQMGHESGGLRWLAEIADGSAYEWRKDLGNTQAGWGRRYKGRGIVQCTGAHNYRKFSQWAFDQGLTPEPMFLFDNPEKVATPEFAFHTGSWYWTVARPQINAMCDAGDLVGVTRAINGGTNGLTDRRIRWDRARRMGARILPGTPATAPPVGVRPTVRWGAKGPDVRDLQARLNRDYPRYSNLTVDGDFGPATDRVVREFQRRAGLAVDGVVGPITWKALHL